VTADESQGPERNGMSKRKRYIVYVTRDEQGTVDRASIPMAYVWVFVAAAITGLFTLAGMAGSYSRMLAKAETVNRLRDQLNASRRDYAHLEKSEHEKDVQAASLGSLASEVSVLYGMTAGRLVDRHVRGAGVTSAAALVAKAPLKDEANGLTDESYYKSVDTFYALRDRASSEFPVQSDDPGKALRGQLNSLGGLSLDAKWDSKMDGGLDASGSNMPDMWPVLGPINSGFGEREDPILGVGTGEFHKGVDIGAPDGTPVHAPADGRVVKAGMGTGYGREIQIDHGNGIVTVYGHLSGWNVTDGESVVKGQVIGFTGHSGHTQGHHLHYEVQVRGNAVNPHKYLRTTIAELGGEAAGGL
jgi:murein DD-endopeptidase MepM/ murein hydrolase activator NlpD